MWIGKVQPSAQPVILIYDVITMNDGVILQQLLLLFLLDVMMVSVLLLWDCANFAALHCPFKVPSPLIL
jgi:hypothetical protein